MSHGRVVMLWRRTAVGVEHVADEDLRRRGHTLVMLGASHENAPFKRVGTLRRWVRARGTLLSRVFY